MSKNFKRVMMFCLALITVFSAIPFGSVAATDWISANVRSAVFDANYYAANNKDVVNALGTSTSALYNHFLQYGGKEGRQGSPIFHSKYYLANNADLKAAFGTNNVNGINHFGSYGYKEPNRKVAKVENLGDSFAVRITASGAKVIGLSGDDTALETESSSDDSQIWIFTRNSDETYTVTNKSTGKVLDVYAASTSSGTKIHTYAGNESNAQKWYIFKYSTGKYILRSKCAPTCVMTVSGSKLLSSTYTGASSQIFTLVECESATPEVTPDPTPEVTPTPTPDPAPEVTPEPEETPEEEQGLGTDFYARIMGVSSKKYLDISGDNVVINTVKNIRTQVWHFKLNSDGAYTITNRSTGKVLDVYAAGTANGTNVQTYASNNTAAQRWFVKEMDGQYVLEPKNAPSKALDVYANATADGSNVQIYQYNGTAAQKYTILKLNEDEYTENTVWYATKSITVEAGKSCDLNKFHVQFSKNSAITDGKDITWSSSQITVTSGNVITPEKGTYKINAKCGSSSVTVTVLAVEDQPVLYQLSPHPEMLGNSYVIKTKNDKLIVIDGGGKHYNEKGFIYEELQRISGKEVPEVEAWFLSHPHDDHMTEFTHLVNNTSNEIVIKNVYLNFPSKSFMASSENGMYSYVRADVRTAYDKLFGSGSFDAVNGKTAFEGDIINIDGVEFEILLTVTDAEKETNINDTSMIFRATIEGQTVLFLGDAYTAEGDRLLQKYGSALKSDIVQMSHHGQAGVRKEVYQAIAPTVCLWPSGDWVYENHSGTLQTFNDRQWMSDMGVKYHLITGLYMTQSLYFPIDYSALPVIDPAP